MNFRLRLVLLAFVCLISSLHAARETPVEAGVRTQTLYLGNGAEPGDLDPQIVTTYSEFNILLALFEGLTSIDEATSQPVPAAAERWDVSSDGRVYTFHLRTAARWTNGDPVTARDFVTSFQRILMPTLAAEYAYMLFPLKNAEAYNTGKLTDFAQVGARALDEHTLELTLENATPYFLSLIAHQAWFPIHAPTILKFGKLDQRGSRWTQPGNLVGNGAYKLTEWQPNQQLTVTKADTYWDSGHTRLNSVVFLPNDNIPAEERNFRTGQVHITWDVLPEKIPVYRKNSPEKLRIDPFLETMFIRFNVTKPPFDNKKLRQALARAIDRDAIAQKLLFGSRLPAYYFTPPALAGYTCASRVPSDFEAARRLLAEAGYPGGKGLPVIELTMNSDAINQKVFEAIQEMWRRELGITLQLNAIEYRVYIDRMKAIQFEALRARWVGDYNDPNTYLDMLVTGGGNNQTGWSNAEYDRLIAEAGRTADQKTRYELFQKAEAILLDEAPIAPVFHGTRVFLIHPSVKGWAPSLLGIHRYQKIWLE